MEMHMYTIRDLVAEDNGPLFAAKNDAVAMRSYNRLMAEVENPGEYVLYHVFSYDHSAALDPDCVDLRHDVYPVTEKILENEVE